VTLPAHIKVALAWWSDLPTTRKWVLASAIAGLILAFGAWTGALRAAAALVVGLVVGPRAMKTVFNVATTPRQRIRESRRIEQAERAEVARRDREEAATDAAFWEDAREAAERSGEVSDAELDDLGHGL